MKRSTKILFFALVLAGVSVFVTIISLYVVLFHGSPGIPDGAYLVVRPGGLLVEQPAVEDPLADVLGAEGAASVIEIDSALRKAAIDDRIAGVVVRVTPLASGLGKVQELRDAIHRFRDECDKPIVAWMDTAGTKEYYLASACSEIYMPPEGTLMFTGLRFAVMYYQGTFEKLGLEADFARVGQYKSAVEPYLRQDMSEDSREMYNSLADSLFGQIVEGVATDREVEPSWITALIDDPPLSAKAAAEVGLIDEVLYRDELEERFKPIEEDEWQLIELETYSRVTPSSLGLGGGPQVAVVYCEGVIVPGESNPPYYGSDRMMGSSTITRVLEDVREDEEIEAVVLRIDSPGGSALASDLIWREVVLTADVKPVVVSMSDYAASGGYYIAMAADAIVAQPGTLTGSIGIYGGKFSLAGLYDKVGLSVESVERGAYSGLLTSSRPFSAEERAKFEEMIEDFYHTFVTKAAEGRGVAPSEIDQVARGRVWTGEQGLETQLVDELGGFRTALDLAKELAGIDPDDEVSLVLLPAQRTLLEDLLDPTRSAAPPLDMSLSEAFPEVGDSLGHLLAVAPLLGSSTPLAMAPYHITVH